MKKKARTMRKVLLTVFSAMLLVCVTIGATVAYLTSTAKVENTFTVGKVAITLDEAKVGEDGKAITGEGAERVTSNEYKLMPGLEYDKDPTIKVVSDSEKAYLGVKVVITKASATDALLSGDIENVLIGFDKTKWDISSVKDTANDTRTYTLIWKGTEDGIIDSTTAPIVLFSKVKVPSELNNAQLESLQNTKMTITAYAVQKDGFSDAATALKTAFSSEF